jgi:hypothetical protein
MYEQYEQYESKIKPSNFGGFWFSLINKTSNLKPL